MTVEVAMKTWSVDGIWRRAWARACGALAVFAVLAACGPDDSGNWTRNPGGGPPGTSAGYFYVLAQPADSAPADAVYLVRSDTNGMLSPADAARVTTGAGASALIADPLGRSLYVDNNGDGTLSQYAIGPGGVLAPLVPATVPNVAGIHPGRDSMAIDPTGQFLYVTNQESRSLSQFHIAANGALSPLAPATVSIAGYPMNIVMDPDGARVHVSVLSGTGPLSLTQTELIQYAIGSDGTLQPPVTQIFAIQGFASGAAISPDSRHVLDWASCANDSCTTYVSAWTSAAGGALTPAGWDKPLADHLPVIDMTFDRTASSVYLMANSVGIDTNFGELWRIDIGSSGLPTGLPRRVLSVSPHSFVGQARVGDAMYALTWDIGIAPIPYSGHLIRLLLGGPALNPMPAESVPIAGARPVALTYAPAR
jgi:hypothetical protein